jgi:signal transduction histidine kinase/HD-like signal output (HDOD) protein
MTDNPAGKNTAQQVELAIKKLDSLAILSQVGATFLEKINDYSLSPQRLFELVLCDPALTCKVLALSRDKKRGVDAGNVTVTTALDDVSLRKLRDAFFGMNIYDYAEASQQRIDMRKEMTTYAIAVATACQLISNDINPAEDHEPAYIAGLLVNIGNFAIDDAMPRSFSAMVNQAKSERKSIAQVQKNFIGTDYTIIGKRFAKNINLPENITNAIWLSRSNTAAIADSIENADLAPIVQLAEFLVRQCGIGDCGSYDLPSSPANVVKRLAITGENLQRIRKILPEKVDERIQLAGLDSAGIKSNYGKVVHFAAAQMANDNSRMVTENQRLNTSVGHFDFVTDLIAEVKNAADTTEIAETIAAKWQKFYQTGSVCVYFQPAPETDFVEAAIAENDGNVHTVIIEKPLDQQIIPAAVQNKFDVLASDQCDPWLLNEMASDLVFEQLRLVPVINNNNAVGAIIFELRQPVPTETLVENLKPISQMIATTLQMSLNCRQQRALAEKFVELLAEAPAEAVPEQEIQTPEIEKQQPIIEDTYEILTELAAGAAHELNNPLSVIAGRSQILTQRQTDQSDIEALEEITKNAELASGIIDDLMRFANPEKPQPQICQTSIIIEEAAELCKAELKNEDINIKSQIEQNAEKLFADSPQVVSALANILKNSVEAYGREQGEIRLSAKRVDDMVEINIADDGAGMDEKTVEKAAYPFFSKLSAGRKRGMGLAFAKRYAQLNNGKLQIQSTPDNGTSVTITLPVTSA